MLDGEKSMSLGKLPHSHSTPIGAMDGGGGGGGGGTLSHTASQQTLKKAGGGGGGGKMLALRVHMLDDSVTMFQIQAKAVGRVLFDQVCKQLHLLEADYFGLEYQDVAGTRYWVDLEKPVSRQVGLSLVDPLLRFCVKFYTPDPAQLEEEFTRYLFCLQVKRDLAHGHIQCNDNTAALMASYIVQAECGDFVAEDYPDPSYLSVYKFVPHQDLELERRIMENHKKHVGQSPAEADLNLLETARRCELYGMKMHPAKDHEGVPLNLSVAHMGIVVFQNYTKINTFSWAKIRKISFKRKRFLIKLHPEGYGYYKDTVEFFFEGRNECKNFWKKCVENHGFFRCSIVKKVPRQRTRVLSRGSSFRYSGKTQKQIVEFVRENYVKRQTFQRSQSFRHSSSVHSSVGMNVGGSLSAHPLLPLGDSSAVSLSCGSMSLAGTAAAARGRQGAASPSPTVRRVTRTSLAAIVTAEAEAAEEDTDPDYNTTPSHHATITITQGQINTSTSYQHHRKPSSTSSSQQQLYFDYDDSDDRQSFCRHCGEELESISSSRRSSRSRRELSPVARNRSSQTDIVANIDYGEDTDEPPPPPPPTYRWQRSASCKELGPPEPLDIPLPQPLDEPITRYDDTRRSCYSVAGSKTPSLDRSNVDAPETKVYSSSYPGTTSSLSTESGGQDDCVPNLEAGGSVLIIDTGSSHEEMVLSHDDLSHDSYELLEREHCELYESHSLSMDSEQNLPDDEMFVMDDDFDSKDNSDVEKRLGYVEPRYAGMDFNEFNEKCKQEIANKRAVEFHEFDAKCKPGMVIGFDSEASSTLQHYPVERTKSDPYVSDFWKVAKQHRRLLHQKSIDLTPTESSVDSGGAEEYNKNAPCTSKSVIDIPYTLHKRTHLDMYASERPHHEMVRSPQHISPKLSPIYVRKSPEKSPDVVRKAKSPKKVTIDNSDRLSKTKTKPDLNSQDSGLSLSLGTESVDDLQEVLSRNIDNIDNIVGIEFEGKGDEVERKIIKEKVDSRQNSRQSSFENVEMDTLKVDDDRFKAGKSGKKEHFVKGKSEENTRSRKGTLSKVRHVHSADGGMRRDSSFDKRDVQVIKIDSDSSQDVCSCGSDRKETRRRDIKSSSLDSSDPDVIIVEYRGNRKKAFQKRASSGSKDSTDKESKDVRRGSSLDLPKSGSKESKSKQSKDLKQEFKDSKKKSGKLDRNKLSKEDSREKQKTTKTDRDAKHAERMLKKEDSLEGYDKVLSDDNLEKQKTESVTSIEDESTAIGIPDKRKSNTKTVVVSIEKEDNEVVIIEEPSELQKRKEMLKEIPLNKNEEDTSKKTVTTPTKKPVVSPETTWKKFGELPAPISHKRERSPILFARLGLSEGSTFSPSHRQASVVSPSSSRRAKSLDAPVVSLHRLPPVTSFSSKDDTLENDEDEFEEKTQRHGKQLLKDSLRREENQIEEEQLEEIGDNVEVVVEKSEKVEEKNSKDKPKVIENIHRPMEDLTAIGNSSGSSVELPEEPLDEGSTDEASGVVVKGSRDDISVTLEKLDEVVDRVKDNKFTNKKGTKVDNLVLDSSELKEGLSPCLSPNTDTKSPCLSPKDLPPRSPCLSPNDPPHSPCRVPAGEPSPCAERRPSTRKERLDSFKNTKSYSVDIWTSEETDAPGIPTLDVDDINIDFTSNDYDDETFITEPENPDDSDKLKDINIKVIETVIKTTEEVIKAIESCSRRSTVDEDVGEVKAAEVMSTEDECWESTEEMPERNVTTTEGEETEEDNKVLEEKIESSDVDVKVDEGEEGETEKKMLSEVSQSSTEKVRETLKESLQLEVIEPLDEPSTSGVRFIPEKRSFDEEPSSSSSKSVKPELSSTWKPFPLESSGSSSLEEGIFPPDDTGHYADEEEGSSHSNNGPDDFPTGFGYPMTGAEMIISGYTGGMFGLSRTLSRISERSTTSEQERSDFEDDISTKPSSRSLSVDDESLLSSDRQPSLSSDPPSATDIPFEDRALPDLPPLPPEPRRSTSLLRRPLPLTQEEEWPSPPDSDSPFDTPVISHVETFYMEIKPEEATKVVVVDNKEVDPDNGESSTDENKTLQEETTTQSIMDESEGTVKLAAVRPKSRFGGNSVSEDTSVGVCADFSSSSGTGTGTTVKHCQYYSCTVKSDDNSSLAGDFGLSLSTEMISSRKSSDDATEKFHTKPSALRLPQRSFDDYDSPCTDSDEGQAAALISPTRTTLKRRLQQSPSHQFIGQRSGSVPLSPTGVTGIKKFMEHRSKHRMGMKCTPYYSAPVPVSHEIRDVSEAIDRRGSGGGGSSRSIARSKCYSYYSLARDPPSDGSSSSLDNQDPPTAPNTIPRVSKKRRHHGASQKRFRHRVSVDMEVRDGHIVSVSSPSVIVACGGGGGGDNNGRQQTASRETTKTDNSRAATQQQQLTKQSSV